ncbi:short-chain dehydrogenase/reductase SDR [Gonapodya prolifera JEL478]|uniref:Short-chain dehydrogenase/reductase SDR n=1 Tax=Gonapodya prolifera (strain JEL478) TaxID=1344416 RepID=A0A138ZYI4_GONPJ|nr:short-chain dehydrogenase/reductase SDR [Gonapodya prolifera JEL478]|eukprot:KXS09173.1 short-chain dehydrogenase/reductase SDR [Gonapodya prolifera JEL478]
MPGLVIVIGVGPGIGAAVARKFAERGHTVCMMARTTKFMENTDKEIKDAGGKSFMVLTDCTQPERLKQSISEARAQVAPDMPLDCLVYNAAARIEMPVMKLTEKHMETSYRLNILAPFVCAQVVVPIMEKQGFGAILITGATASIRGNPNFVAFASTKHGKRALAQSLAKEIGPLGIHVAHFIIDGAVSNSRIRHVFPGREWGPPERSMSPDAISEVYYQVFQQDRSAWTFELDLRPFTEKF